MRIIRMCEKNYLEKEEIRKRLCEKMLKRREKLELHQSEVAESLGKSEKTYQRWESTGTGLSNLFDVLSIFRVLQFPLTDIIYVLGLPPLTLSEAEELYQDEETLKRIRESSIYSAVRQACGGMENITVEKLLDTLMAERLRRKNNTK